MIHLRRLPCGGGRWLGTGPASLLFAPQMSLVGAVGVVCGPRRRGLQPLPVLAGQAQQRRAQGAESGGVGGRGRRVGAAQVQGIGHAPPPFDLGVSGADSRSAVVIVCGRTDSTARIKRRSRSTSRRATASRSRSAVAGGSKAAEGGTRSAIGTSG